MINNNQDISFNGFLSKEIAERKFGKIVKKIEPYYYDQVPDFLGVQADIELEDNQMVFSTEIGYTCFSETTRTQYTVNINPVNDNYIYIAEIGGIFATSTVYRVSDKITNRWVKSIINITNTSFIYIHGHLITFEEDLI